VKKDVARERNKKKVAGGDSDIMEIRKESRVKRGSETVGRSGGYRAEAFNSISKDLEKKSTVPQK